MISALATGYLFLGGAGSGALFVLCLIEFARTVRDIFPKLPVFSYELLRRSWAASLLCLCLGVAFLTFDLGNFEAVIYMVMSPQPVALSIGAFSLPVAIACAAAFLGINGIDGVRASIWIVRILAVVGIMASAIVMGYTGILLQDMASVLAWQTPLVPVLFVLSSLSCGVALVLGSVAFVETRVPLVGLISKLIRIDSALIVFEALVLAVYIIAGIQGSETRDAMFALVGGSLSPAFWIALVGIGLVIPFVMEQMVTFSSHRHQLLFIAAAILVGGLAMRYCIVGLAVFDPAYATYGLTYNQYGLLI